MLEEIKKSLHLRVDDERDLRLRERGILFVDDEVDIHMYRNFCRDLIYVSEKCVAEQKPIWVVINSPGGDVHHGIGMHDAIRLVVGKRINVNILGMGVVASMASVIMQAGTKRFATPQTQFLLHQVSDSIFFKNEEVNEAEERAEEMKRINRIVCNIIAQRCGLGIEDLLSRTKKKDFWLDASGAKELGTNGLIDEVTTELPF